jgi:hypothetical protein
MALNMALNMVPLDDTYIKNYYIVFDVGNHDSNGKRKNPALKISFFEDAGNISSQSFADLVSIIQDKGLKEVEINEKPHPEIIIYAEKDAIIELMEKGGLIECISKGVPTVGFGRQAMEARDIKTRVIERNWGDFIGNCEKVMENFMANQYGYRRI